MEEAAVYYVETLSDTALNLVVFSATARLPTVYLRILWYKSVYLGIFRLIVILKSIVRCATYSITVKPKRNP